MENTVKMPNTAKNNKMWGIRKNKNLLYDTSSNIIRKNKRKRGKLVYEKNIIKDN